MLGTQSSFKTEVLHLSCFLLFHRGTPPKLISVKDQKGGDGNPLS